MNLNRRVPVGLPGGVRGRKFIIAFSYSISKPKALATLGVYRKLVHIPKVYHKKEVVRNCEKQIKKGVLMINTSRGEIIDTNALIEGIENEQEVIHIDHNYNVIKNRDLLILKAYLNVIVTPHEDFYTE